MVFSRFSRLRGGVRTNARHFTRFLWLPLAALLVLATGSARAVIMPVVQGALTGSDTVGGDGYGSAVAMDGGRILVGAMSDADNGTAAGAAFLFEQQPNSTWSQVAKLHGNDTAAYDDFGNGVAISGDRAVVAADGNANDINYYGSVYVFDRQSNGSWTQTQKINYNDGNVISFASSVAVDSSIILVGDQFSMVNSDTPGAVYVFEKQVDGSSTFTFRLVPSDPSNAGFFGSSCALDGTRAIVGGWNGTYGGTSSGGAYIYERQNDGTWNQVAELIPNDPANGQGFGYSVALLGDRAVVGAFGDGQNGNGAGAAYIFDRQPNGTWTQTQKILPDDPEAQATFGSAVALLTDQTIVGSPASSGGGAVYIFEPNISSVWQQTYKIANVGPGTDAELGSPCAASGTQFVAVDQGYDGVGSALAFGFADVTPTPTATPSPTATPTPTASPTASPTPTLTPTASPSPSPTASPTESPTPTATASATPSETPTATATASPSATATPTATATASATATPTGTPTATASATASPTPTATGSATASPTPTATGTATASPTATATPSPTATISPTATPTQTGGPTPTETVTPTITPTATPSPTESPTATATATGTATATPTETASPSPSPTLTASPTPTPSVSGLRDAILGRTQQTAGLDVNGDGVVDVADLIQTLKQ